MLLKESVRFAIRGMKSHCTFELSDDLWVVEVDEGQLTQVVGNLIINANQAMPNGGTISIRTDNVELSSESGLPLPSGRYVKLIFEDQGVGISKKHLQSIFDPYFTTKQAGSGLGLTITYSIIKRHGGHISVYSDLDRGTSITVYLPASSKAPDGAEEIEEITHRGRGRILVMDDQVSILKIIARMLGTMGYDVATAVDGAQTIKIYADAFHSANPFDLVILDLTIPGGMGGTKTVIELMKIDPDVKAVVSSGYSNDSIMANYRDYGFCGVIPKPFMQHDLVVVLNEILGKTG